MTEEALLFAHDNDDYNEVDITEHNNNVNDDHNVVDDHDDVDDHLMRNFSRYLSSPTAPWPGPDGPAAVLWLGRRT